MPLTKDYAIIAQNAATAAATLLQGTGATYEQYEDIRTRIFNRSVELGGGEAIVELFNGAEAAQAPPVSVAQAAPVAPSVLGGGDNDPGSIELKFGKYKGQTIAQVGDENPGYLVWIAGGGMSNNDFLTSKVNEFLNANPAVRQAGELAQASR